MENKKRIIILTSFGLLLAFFGLFVLFFGSKITTTILHGKLVLVPENPGFELWRDMNIPIYQNFYIFNITNPNDVMNGGKPNIKEIGPIVYRVNISKPHLSFSQKRNVVTFSEFKHFHHQPKMSSADLNTPITTLNLPLITVYKMIDSPKINPFIRFLLRIALKQVKGEQFIITATIDELLFKGKYSGLLCFLHKLQPKLAPECSFSFMKNQNNSIQGPYMVYTGLEDISQISSIITYNGSSKLNIWSGDLCNDLSMSNNGELFAPAGTFGSIKHYKFFRPDFCRVFNFTLEESNILSEVNGLRTDRFRIDKKSFLNSTEYPPNACYKAKDDQSTKTLLKKDKNTIAEILHFFNLSRSVLDLFKEEDEMKMLNSENIQSEMPSGVFDMSPCNQGAPIFLSYPHFLEADPIYLQKLDGLKPNFTKHRSYMDIEPQTGTPVDFIARIQANVNLQTKNTKSPQIKSLLLPVFWQEFSIHITNQIAHTITSQTQTLSIASYSISFLFLIIGIALLVYAIVIYRRVRQVDEQQQQQDSDPLISDESTNTAPIID